MRIFMPLLKRILGLACITSLFTGPISGADVHDSRGVGEAVGNSPLGTTARGSFAFSTRAAADIGHGLIRGSDCPCGFGEAMDCLPLVSDPACESSVPQDVGEQVGYPFIGLLSKPVSGTQGPWCCEAPWNGDAAAEFAYGNLDGRLEGTREGTDGAVPGLFSVERAAKIGVVLTSFSVLPIQIRQQDVVVAAGWTQSQLIALGPVIAMAAERSGRVTSHAFWGYVLPVLVIVYHTIVALSMLTYGRLRNCVAPIVNSLRTHVYYATPFSLRAVVDAYQARGGKHAIIVALDPVVERREEELRELKGLKKSLSDALRESANREASLENKLRADMAAAEQTTWELRGIADHFKILFHSKCDEYNKLVKGMGALERRCGGLEDGLQSKEKSLSATQDQVTYWRGRAYWFENQLALLAAASSISTSAQCAPAATSTPVLVPLEAPVVAGTTDDCEMVDAEVVGVVAANQLDGEAGLGGAAAQQPLVPVVPPPQTFSAVFSAPAAPEILASASSLPLPMTISMDASDLPPLPAPPVPSVVHQPAATRITSAPAPTLSVPRNRRVRAKQMANQRAGPASTSALPRPLGGPSAGSSSGVVGSSHSSGAIGSSSSGHMGSSTLQAGAASTSRTVAASCAVASSSSGAIASSCSSGIGLSPPASAGSSRGTAHGPLRVSVSSRDAGTSVHLPAPPPDDMVRRTRMATKISNFVANEVPSPVLDHIYGLFGQIDDVDESQAYNLPLVATTGQLDAFDQWTTSAVHTSMGNFLKRSNRCGLILQDSDSEADVLKRKVAKPENVAFLTPPLQWEDSSQMTGSDIEIHHEKPLSGSGGTITEGNAHREEYDLTFSEPDESALAVAFVSILASQNAAVIAANGAASASLETAIPSMEAIAAAVVTAASLSASALVGGFMAAWVVGVLAGPRPHRTPNDRERELARKRGRNAGGRKRRVGLKSRDGRRGVSCCLSGHKDRPQAEADVATSSSAAVISEVPIEDVPKMIYWFFESGQRNQYSLKWRCEIVARLRV
ncbi:hypothetical protein M427DRAFT_44506 [Gonapodya prolifera JEL478]|uniref:SUN domain-containing protein n=1 Tax=Gonapodya prolifera (strain JEL478) TaxID=1344416 RepID=A0A139AGB3_GONPJ|nr:hypothetical protein M427DRAFT_44506 [Gonapodya prolifera JEL478]|eukprot:KXS15453.1 hypothetical protein M427DRAFT_44506 [Gonapodya prolifera JEL478]